MSVLKVIEIMSSSKKSWEDATESGVAKASATLKNIRSAWVQDQSVTVEKGKIKEYRVTLKLSFELEK
ncbi:MAG: dodecin domain-containing protein [Saprospiraceae bacterium]|nr:dodecin domain-containing protein [Saprospiraceae bacterium]MBP9211084.1 dodecin domain-containing protein [Saprospiraceae bacterium]MBV6473988.1 Calcium dodecin [Saprospiraceae bacterium]